MIEAASLNFYSNLITAWAAVNMVFLVYVRLFCIAEYKILGQEKAEEKWRSDPHTIWRILSFVVLPLAVISEKLLDNLFEAGHYEFMVKENAEKTKQILEEAGEL